MNPKTWLRLEGLFGVIICIIAYWYLKYPLSWFLIGLFLPDAFMLGYLVNNRIGARIYNLGHVRLFPFLLFLWFLLTREQICFAAALIWMTHIFMDIMFGYGLKYEEGFQITHMHKLN